MTLLEQLNKDMVVSMKNKDSFSLGVIRMAKGAIQLEAINKKQELTNDDMVAVISKQIKMRNDSINEFTKAGRTDLVEQNQKEIDILNKYMPAQLSEEEINIIIQEAFDKLNPTSIKIIINTMPTKVLEINIINNIPKLTQNKINPIHLSMDSS